MILLGMSRILKTDGTEVVGNVSHALTLSQRMRGLIGRPAPSPGCGLLLSPCRSIHMGFMRYPIDAAFLDRDLRVLKIARGLRPWRISIAPLKTQHVLETAAGELAQLQGGEQLFIES